MTNIIYKIIADFGECTDFIGDGSSNVRVEVRGAESGSLVIGSACAKLTSGVAHIDLSRLGDGEYSPQLFVGHKRVPLEKIRITDGRLSRVVIDPDLIERLLERVAQLESTAKDLLYRIEVCEMSSHPKTLFN